MYLSGTLVGHDELQEPPDANPGFGGRHLEWGGGGSKWLLAMFRLCLEQASRRAADRP